MSDKLKFDCGNRSETCDNEAVCPCLKFVNKTIQEYGNGLKSDLWKDIKDKILDRRN